MTRGRCAILAGFAAGLMGVGVAVGDEVVTTDGKALSGEVRLGDGMVVIRTPQGPGRLPWEQVRSLQRGGTAVLAAGPVEPRGLLATFYADILWGQPVATMRTGDLDLDWGNDAPAPDVPKDQFTTRLTGTLDVPTAGAYRFMLRGDDAASLEIGGRRVLDKIGDSQPIDLPAGPVPIVVDQREDFGEAKVSVAWEGPGVASQVISAERLAPPKDHERQAYDVRLQRLRTWNGLRAQYFADPQFKQVKHERTEDTIDFQWRPNQEPAAGLRKGFAARYTGKIRGPKDGKVTLRLNTDNPGPTRVWVGGKAVIDAWENKTARREAEVEMKVGQLYDLRVDYVADTEHRELRLHWNATGDFKAIPATALVAPDDAPRVLLIKPAAGEAVDGAEGVTLTALPFVARGRVGKVEFITAPDNKVIATATAEPWTAAAKLPDAGGEVRVAARATAANGATAVSPWVTLTVDGAAASGGLGEGWRTGVVGDAEPLTVTRDGEAVRLTGKRGAFGNAARMASVQQPLDGDGEVVAHLQSVAAPAGGGANAAASLAGVTLRAGMSPRSPQLSLVAGAEGGWVVARGPRDRDMRYDEAAALRAPVWLRVSRTGGVARAFASTDGQDWTPAGTLPIGEADRVYVGLTTFTLNADAETTATFDQVRVTRGSPSTLAPGPGVQLRTGSVVCGELTISDAGPITVKPTDGRPRVVPRDQVARVFFGPVTHEQAAGIGTGRVGALVGGDFLEGDVVAMAADRVSINSLIFGPRTAGVAQGLTAVVLANVEPPAPNAWTIDWTGGRIVAPQVRIEGDRLVAKDPVAGEFRIATNELISAERAK